MKFCPQCKQWKHLEDFPGDATRAGGRWHTCKHCHNQRRRLRRAEARERRNQELLLSGPPGPPSDLKCVSAMLDARMVFSALADADYLATEQHFQPEAARMREPAAALRPEEAEAAL